MKSLLTTLLSLCLIVVIAQQDNLKNVPSGLRNTGPLTFQDAVALSTIEEVKLPPEYRQRSLPDSVDNSQHEWFRPIFSQIVYPNCMQSTSIAYGFTYEINRLRGLPADTADNQYTTHFAWNFFNGGNGWYGANYLYTMDVLKHHGTPTVTAYGGIYNGGGERWMSGYDLWKSAMNNRISGVRQIYVGDEEGLLTLKHWLNDHLDGSSSGGIASFIACSPWGLEQLPPGTPNAGKNVIIEFCDMATHGMTIVGYNDSIRFDYNEDGQYTNNIDLNGDGRITMSDWEIGAVKMANSHGLSFGDDGFAYMMYKTLADDIHEGGIWANRVHILDVKEQHNTLVTCKVVLEHDYRGRIKVTTGISSDINDNVPEYIRDYTIFNYQGGWHYMQGVDTIPEKKAIEFALDLSPLLSYVEPGSPCKFFLIVDEKDPENLGNGKVKYFSIIDHTNGDMEYVCDEENVPLVENGRTLLPVVCPAPGTSLQIITEELPLLEAGQPVEVQLQAGGGEEPYTWSVDRNYNVLEEQGEFPLIDDSLIMANSYYDTIVIQELPFSFPFYGNYFDHVAISSSGYLQFDENMVFWSYLVDLPYFLRNNRVIAPFLCTDMMVFDIRNDGIWYEGDAGKASFRWKTTLIEQSESSTYNFAVSLYPDGNIDFYFGEMEFEGNMRRVTGVSNGDMVNYTLPEMPDPRDIETGKTIRFLNGNFPDGLSISDNGLLSISQQAAGTISDVDVVVTDNTLVSSFRSYQLTGGLELWLEVPDERLKTIPNGQLTDIRLIAKNRGNTDLSNLQLDLYCDHPLVQLPSDSYSIGSLPAGESRVVPDAFSCLPDVDIPDKTLIELDLRCEAGDETYLHDYYFFASAPEIGLHEYYINTPSGILEPGYDTEVSITLFNGGSHNSINTTISLQCDDAGITINDSLPVNAGTIAPGGYASAGLSINADYGIPYGTKIDFEIKVNDEIGLVSMIPLTLRVGKTPVCVLDMDPGEHSGPQIHEFLDQMGVENDYIRAFPLSLNNYQSVILCLGIQFSNHELTLTQSNVLTEYLDQGGNLYMEGRVVWEQEEQWPVFEKFSFGTTSTPAMYEALIGVDSTFTEGMGFENGAAQPFCYYYLEPQGSAFPVLTGNEYPYCAAVAYDAGDYKTLGTIFELGELISNDSCQVEQYVRAVLDFFGVMQSSLGIDDQADVYAYAKAAQNFPNPFSTTTRIPLRLEKKSYVAASVYDLSGRKLKDLQPPQWMGEGEHYLSWDGRNSLGQLVPGGIYIYRLLVDGYPYSGKMVFTR